MDLNSLLKQYEHLMGSQILCSGVLVVERYGDERWFLCSVNSHLTDHNEQVEVIAPNIKEEFTEYQKYKRIPSALMQAYMLALHTSSPPKDYRIFQKVKVKGKIVQSTQPHFKVAIDDIVYLEVLTDERGFYFASNDSLSLSDINFEINKAITIQELRDNPHLMNTTCRIVAYLYGKENHAYLSQSKIDEEFESSYQIRISQQGEFYEKFHARLYHVDPTVSPFGYKFLVHLVGKPIIGESGLIEVVDVRTILMKSPTVANFGLQSWNFKSS